MQQLPLHPPITIIRTDGELVEGDSCAVVAQGVADAYGDLVLDGREQVHVANVAAVLEGWVLLTDHNFGAVPGKEGGPGTVTNVKGQVGAGWGKVKPQGWAGVLDARRRGRGQRSGLNPVKSAVTHSTVTLKVLGM